MTREDKRQLVHASMTAFVVLFRWISWPVAAGVAGAAVLLNWFVLPRLGWGRELGREGGPWMDGVKLYPVAVLAVILLFRSRDHLDAPAVAWAVLGIGDAASNVLGRRFGRPPFLGRTDRTIVGTGAFFACALPAAIAAAFWVVWPDVDHRVVLAAAAAAAAGAVVELLVPPRWDDNVAIAVAAGGAYVGVLHVIAS